ncbi:MAG TPA: helix-turn-helix domain-containing protein [Verrucomicrobiae bacterium]|jgi:DNA-binding MarR family transcriptional regulator|nr:helix-turn-helix domain-containing protein [Verrucomicrobiae bacterium]
MDETSILAKTFAKLCRDSRIKPGAFRLWHAFYHHRNNETGLCFPGQRLLSEEVNCDIASIKKWTKELEAAGWLRTTRGDLGQGFRYTLFDKDGNALPCVKTK